MGVSSMHLFRQGPMLRTMLRAGKTIVRHWLGKTDGPLPETPGPVMASTIGARADSLIRDFIRHIGGDPSWYRGVVPPTLFPQWGLPAVARTVQSLPYDLRKVLNGGCTMEIRHPIPVGQPLQIRANLELIDETDTRVVIQQRLETGTEQQPDCLIVRIIAIIPLGSGSAKSTKEKPRVPETAREIDRLRLGKRSGLDFSLLTGDFNPIHWIPTMARIGGFKNTIMHGYSTMARAVESLNRNLWAGCPDRLKSLEVRFVKPLVYPSNVGVYLDEGGGLFVGDAHGGPAYMTGHITTHQEK